mmetsp:Transcript_20618/g.63970  ORF Transcript_20618/g.63970 Transcript_20618/m.63970 type:complete len:218 (-) Transcript_20618:901-1554(-)
MSVSSSVARSAMTHPSSKSGSPSASAICARRACITAERAATARLTMRSCAGSYRRTASSTDDSRLPGLPRPGLPRRLIVRTAASMARASLSACSGAERSSTVGTRCRRMTRAGAIGGSDAPDGVARGPHRVCFDALGGRSGRSPSVCRRSHSSVSCLSHEKGSSNPRASGDRRHSCSARIHAPRPASGGMSMTTAKSSSRCSRSAPERAFFELLRQD